MKILKIEAEELSQQNPKYKKATVIAFTEENPSACYSRWDCVTIRGQGTGGDQNEQMNFPVFDKGWSLYDSFCKIGIILTEEKNKGAGQISTILKTNTKLTELFPSLGELFFLESDKYISLITFYEFHSELPDLQLEGELICPPEPEIHY